MRMREMSLSKGRTKTKTWKKQKKQQSTENKHNHVFCKGPRNKALIADGAHLGEVSVARPLIRNQQVIEMAKSKQQKNLTSLINIDCYRWECDL